MFKEDALEGKRILVTGGGSGLGKEMAKHFLSHGAEVIICGRRDSVLKETENELAETTNGKISSFSLDIRDSLAIEEAIDTVFANGGLDGLVNNAAGNFISRTKDLSPNAFNAIASIVFHGTFNMTNTVGKKWIEQNKPGSILSITTTWVWTGSPFVVPSAMSKSGINAMTKSLAVEWGPHNIRLNCIAPGPFPTEGAWSRLSPETEGNKGALDQSSMSSNPMGRVGEMSELGNLATFLMSDGCDYLTGQTIAIDGAAYLSAGGTFASLGKLKDDDWTKIRDNIKKSNEKDKNLRNTK